MQTITLLKVNRVMSGLLALGLVCVCAFSAQGIERITQDMMTLEPVVTVEQVTLVHNGVVQAVTAAGQYYEALDGVGLSFVLDVPAVQDGGITLLHYQTSYSSLEASVDGQPVYTFKGREQGALMLPDPLRDHYIPLRPEYYGKTVRLMMTPVTGAAVWVRPVLLTTQTRVLTQVIFKELWCICLDIVIIITGLMLLTAYFAILRFAKHPTIFWLGLLLVCYVLHNSIFFESLFGIYHLSQLYQTLHCSTLTLLGVMWLFFTFYLNRMRHPTLFNAMITVMLTLGIAAFVLHVTGLLGYSRSAWAIELAVVCTWVVSLGVLLADFHRVGDYGRWAVFGVVSALALIAADFAGAVIQLRRYGGPLLYIALLTFVVCYAIELSLKGIDALVLKSRLHALELAAYQDQLTGCANRRAFEQKLSELREKKAERGLAGLAVVMLDSNNLKVVNDTYGHAYGDQLLVLTAQTLRHYLESFGTIFRIGGDEFVLVCDVADRAQLNLAMEKFECEVNVPEEISVDLSWGVAYYEPEIDSSPESVLMRAEHRMYEYKRGCKLYAQLPST